MISVSALQTPINLHILLTAVFLLYFIIFMRVISVFLVCLYFNCCYMLFLFVLFFILCADCKSSFPRGIINCLKSEVSFLGYQDDKWPSNIWRDAWKKSDHDNAFLKSSEDFPLKTLKAAAQKKVERSDKRWQVERHLYFRSATDRRPHGEEEETVQSLTAFQEKKKHEQHAETSFHETRA